MYGKLLRFNDIYGVLCLTAATNTNAADNNRSYLTERILHSVNGRRKRVHNGVDVQFISIASCECGEQLHGSVSIQT